MPAILYDLLIFLLGIALGGVLAQGLQTAHREAAVPASEIVAPRRPGETVCLKDGTGKPICYRLTTLPSGLTQVEPFDPCTQTVPETHTF